MEQRTLEEQVLIHEAHQIVSRHGDVTVELPVHVRRDPAIQKEAAVNDGGVVLPSSFALSRRSLKPRPRAYAAKQQNKGRANGTPYRRKWI